MFFVGTTPGICRCLFNIVPCALERWSSTQLWLSPKLFCWSVKFLVLFRAHTCMGCQPSGSCCFYPYGRGVMLVWVWKTHFCGSFSFNFLSSRKHSRVDMSYFFDYFFNLNLQMWFQIFFNWWHSPLAWWHSQELKFKKSFEINNQFVFSLASFEVRISIISSLFIFNKFLSRTSWDPANYNNFELRLVSSMPQLWDLQRMLLWTIAKVSSVWFMLSIHKFQV